MFVNRCGIVAGTAGGFMQKGIRQDGRDCQAGLARCPGDWTAGIVSHGLLGEHAKKTANEALRFAPDEKRRKVPGQVAQTG